MGERERTPPTFSLGRSDAFRLLGRQQSFRVSTLPPSLFPLSPFPCVSAMAAAAKYAKDIDDEERRDSVKVRAEAGRKCVRQIQHHPVLSGEWLSLVDSLEQLSRLSQLEVMMPPNTKVS